MKPKLLVKLSNIVGVISIILLIYWVFVFVVTEVFGLKVFRQNMTETFYMSILGILALMAGALMINIMFNLTRIADKQNADDADKTSKMRKLGIFFLLSFPLILGLLIGGDYLTARKKQQMLVASAESIVNDNKREADFLVDYNHEIRCLKEVEKTLDLLSKTDVYFPHVAIIVPDTIGNTEVFLEYRSFYFGSDSITPPKENYIFSTTREEREYLSKVCIEGVNEYRFDSSDGNYKLFYPYRKGDKVIVFYFSDYQRYGKIGS